MTVMKAYDLEQFLSAPHHAPMISSQYAYSLFAGRLSLLRKKIPRPKKPASMMANQVISSLNVKDGS
jgi:hypothetical protein